VFPGCEGCVTVTDFNDFNGPVQTTNLGVRSSNLFGAHPTRFERLTFAFGGQGLLEGRAPPQKINRSAVLGYSAFSYSRAAKNLDRASQLYTALGEPKIFALFSVSIVQIISLTVGPNGRWHPRICSMAVVWTFNAPDAGTRRVFSIEDRIWDGQMTSVSATVGCSVQAWESNDRFARAEVALGMISKRHLFKGTFGFEMHLML